MSTGQPRLTRPRLRFARNLSVSSLAQYFVLAAALACAADEAPPVPAAAETLARSAALRATLPAPAEAWTFEGELLFQGFLIGSLSIRAEPSTFKDRPCWEVVERSVREAGKARVVSEIVVTLAPDLSLLRGETVQRAPGGGSVTSFGWRDGVLEVIEQQDGGASRSATPSVAPASTLGLFALSRFAALLAKEPARGWMLPIFDPRFAFGDDAGKPLAADLADLALTVLGPSKVYRSLACAVPHPALAVKAEAAWGRSLTLQLDATSHTLLAVDGGLPRVHIRRAGGIWPNTPPPWFERVGQPPASALEAFVSFGRGYHLPKRELLEGAFHWESMRAAEIAAGSYPADVTLEKVREDWVAEFERMSKHRTEGDCDDLLMQLLTTSTITTNADGSVTITSLPVFGGHAYTCAEKDGRWWITKID